MVAIDCSVTAFTVSVSLGLTTAPSVAVICVVPALTPVASPVVAPTVPTPVLEDVQVTLAVMFLVLASL